MASDRPQYTEILKGFPTNWRRWGEDDELGGLNFLGPSEVRRGVGAVRSGRVFTLGCRIGAPGGDPLWPGRVQAQRYNTRDRGTYLSGKAEPFPGGLEYADDMIMMFLHGSTHVDALGHCWFDGKMYNGFEAESSMGGMARASVLPLAEHGVVGRGVLVDMARYKGRDRLERGESFSLEDLKAAAESQGLVLRKHDILLVRTGWLQVFYEEDRSAVEEEPFLEPGLGFSSEVVDWFKEMEVPAYGTDTLANEVTLQPGTGVHSALHASLMRNLGVTFHEIVNLDKLAEDCGQDGQYDFMFVAAPLKVINGTAAPANPVAIK